MFQNAAMFVRHVSEFIWKTSENTEPEIRGNSLSQIYELKFEIGCKNYGRSSYEGN